MSWWRLAEGRRSFLERMDFEGAKALGAGVSSTRC